MQLDVLYEDQNYIAVQKPDGLLVHRTKLDFHDKIAAVQILRQQFNQQIFPVHRLDKPTSRVLILARSSEAAQKLSAEFNSLRVEKKYFAIVRGLIKEDVLVDYPLKANVKLNNRENIKSQAAVTLIKAVSRIELAVEVDRYPTSRYSLVEVFPKTGRTHQIRKHLKHLNHPIIGDINYGNGKHNKFFSEELGIQGLLLWCQQLSFVHPYTLKKTDVRSQVPSHFNLALKKLGLSMKDPIDG
jgi:tRNA pseudouridine65 synthase